MNLKSAGKTHVGLVRENNEDSFHIDEDKGIFIVSDGIGGEVAGEVASSSAVSKIVSYLDNNSEFIDNCRTGSVKDEEIFRFFAKAVRHTSNEIYKLSNQSMKYVNMGATLTMAVDMGSRILICHVGDSRAYLLNESGVHQLTEDHTLFTEMQKKGLIKGEQDIQSYMHRTLTRSLGTANSIEVDCLMIPMVDDDKLILCTDGISNYLADEDELSDLVDGNNLEGNVDALIDFAISSKGEDNATAIVIKVGKGSENGEESLQENLIMEILMGCSIYEGLTYQELSAIRSFMEVVSLNKEEVLVQACEKYSGFFIVMDGGILSKDELLIRGDSIGLKALVKEHYCPEDKVAVRNSHLLYLNRRKFDALSVKFPRIANKILLNIIRLM